MVIWSEPGTAQVRTCVKHATHTTGHTSQWSLKDYGEGVFCFLILSLDALTAQAPGADVQVR